MSLPRALLIATFVFSSTVATADTQFIEAETFTPSSDGWRITSGPESQQASGVATLHGAAGAADAVADHALSVPAAARYRVWVRYRVHPTQRGPFELSVRTADRTLASAVFDQEGTPASRGHDYAWKSFDADLPAGPLTLRLAKFQNKNCSSVTRHVDCVVLTTDTALAPDHTTFGPQTYLRVTVGDGYARPVYLHVFADHYRAPWYQHFAVARDGVNAGVAPPKPALLKSGDRTAWCNITPMLYQDSGAILNLSARHAYTEPAERLRMTLEFATAPDDAAVVRKIRADCQPNGLVVLCPPNLLTAENRDRLLTDADLAEQTGKLADAFDWPTFGKPPERFPFLVRDKAAGSANPADARVAARERKTLAYMGFTPTTRPVISGGIWYPASGSFSAPDLDRMTAKAATDAADFKRKGHATADVRYCDLTDEPTGKPASVIAQDPASVAAFRAWLKTAGKQPADLLVNDWDAVRPVAEGDAARFPALHYYTQRFRTRQLGDFMTAQRRTLEAAYGGTFPTLANFSDGAIYEANFYAQGVDYFELLDADAPQNAVWGEDWSNNASTYQCAAYNVDLMRAATRRNHQPIGHFLIAFAGRQPLDVKLKAVGEVARGVKTLESFFYGPTWSSHEGGPAWRSKAWQANPEMWRAHAELAREIGAAEDLLLPAMPAQARVAILYSSASDAWTAGRNLAYGFDRMHTWLALAHAQVPVDVLSEAQVADGALADYQVCYVSGPNLTRAAAERLGPWIRDGGTAWLTADAAARDEYQRDLTTVTSILPARRGPLLDAQPQRGAGRTLASLRTLDQVRVGDASLEVLSVRQPLEPAEGADVLGRYKDNAPALVRGAAGKGTVYVAGFLPALAYVKPALTARAELKADAAPPGDRQALAGSANPWAFPAAVRDVLLSPVRSADVRPPVECNVPLVDAVYMTCDAGAVIPLANYTLRPIEQLTLTVRPARAVNRVESSHRGRLTPTRGPDGRIQVTLPLESTDFVKLYYGDPPPGE